MNKKDRQEQKFLLIERKLFYTDRKLKKRKCCVNLQEWLPSTDIYKRGLMVPLRPQNYESSQNFRCSQQLISSVPDAWESIVDIIDGGGCVPVLSSLEYQYRLGSSQTHAC